MSIGRLSARLRILQIGSQANLEVPLSSPAIRDGNYGEDKVIDFFSGKARGPMARHLAQARRKGMGVVQVFDGLSYRNVRRVPLTGQPVFLQSTKATQPCLA